MPVGTLLCEAEAAGVGVAVERLFWIDSEGIGLLGLSCPGRACANTPKSTAARMRLTHTTAPRRCLFGFAVVSFHESPGTPPGQGRRWRLQKPPIPQLRRASAARTVHFLLRCPRPWEADQGEWQEKS